MARGATVAVQNEIAASSNKPLHLFELYFDGVTIYASDSFRPINWNGNNYPSLGTFISFDGVEEAADLSIAQARVSMSGVEQSMVSGMLGYNYIDRRLVIRKAFLDTNEQVIVDPIAIFDGRCDSPVIAEDPDSGTCSITISASAHFIDFERRPGRHTNHEEQQLWFPGDLGFEYVSQLNKTITWGASSVAPSGGVYYSGNANGTPLHAQPD